MYKIHTRITQQIIYSDYWICVRPYLHHGCRSLLCHIMDSILISQPIRSLHCVVEMPPPVILLHVPQSGIDPTLWTRWKLINKIQLKRDGTSDEYIYMNLYACCYTCAATVWDLVGKSLVMQAVLNPASDRPKAALSPAPPAPTTRASNSWSTTGYWVEIWNRWMRKVTVNDQ